MYITVRFWLICRNGSVELWIASILTLLSSRRSAYEAMERANCSTSFFIVDHVAKEKTLPFYASLQHVKNADMMLMCGVCEIWHLVYSRRKLKQNEKKELEKGLDCMSFSCGTQLQDSDVPECLKDVVFVKNVL